MFYALSRVCLYPICLQYDTCNVMMTSTCYTSTSVYMYKDYHAHPPLQQDYRGVPIIRLVTRKLTNGVYCSMQLITYTLMSLWLFLPPSTSPALYPIPLPLPSPTHLPPHYDGLTIMHARIISCLHEIQLAVSQLHMQRHINKGK